MLYEDSASKVARKAELAKSMLDEQHKECTFKPKRIAAKKSPSKASPAKSPGRASPKSSPEEPAHERLVKMGREASQKRK